MAGRRVPAGGGPCGTRGALEEPRPAPRVGAATGTRASALANEGRRGLTRGATRWARRAVTGVHGAPASPRIPSGTRPEAPGHDEVAAGRPRQSSKRHPPPHQPRDPLQPGRPAPAQTVPRRRPAACGRHPTRFHPGRMDPDPDRNDPDPAPCPGPVRQGQQAADQPRDTARPAGWGAVPGARALALHARSPCPLRPATLPVLAGSGRPGSGPADESPQRACRPTVWPS